MVNSLYFGGEFEKMHEDMISVAREILATDNLSVHPDYLEISIQQGKSSIGVEEVCPIIDLSYRRPILGAEKSVVIINGIDFLTIPAQNKLLLTLEANKNVLILASAKNMDKVIDTVKSRMRKVCYEKGSLKQYEEMFGESGSLMYVATNGDVSRAEKCREYIPLLKKIMDCCLSGKLTDLLPILHLVKEKDPESFGLDKNLMEISLCVISYALEQKSEHCLEDGNPKEAIIYSKKSLLASEELSKLFSVNYTKDNFFLGIVSIIE